MAIAIIPVAKAVNGEATNERKARTICPRHKRSRKLNSLDIAARATRGTKKSVNKIAPTSLFKNLKAFTVVTSPMIRTINIQILLFLYFLNRVFYIKFFNLELEINFINALKIIP